MRSRRYTGFSDPIRAFYATLATLPLRGVTRELEKAHGGLIVDYLYMGVAPNILEHAVLTGLKPTFPNSHYAARPLATYRDKFSPLDACCASRGYCRNARIGANTNDVAP